MPRDIVHPVQLMQSVMQQLTRMKSFIHTAYRFHHFHLSLSFDIL